MRGVTLDVNPGEILAVVGESGSGKSVMGLALLGLLSGEPMPTITGRAEVCGVDMVAASDDERREVRKAHLGAVFQDPMTSLNPTMRVGRQVMEAAGSDEEALRLLDLVGVPDPARRMKAFPHELSGGLRQRVMIAMAVAGKPDLVIADEPTTALDVTVQAQVLGLIRDLCDQLGTSFILVTHDIGVASQVCDRVAVMYGGRLAEEGQMDERAAGAIPPLHRRPPQRAPRPGPADRTRDPVAARRAARPARAPTRLCLCAPLPGRSRSRAWNRASPHGRPRPTTA